MNHPGFMRSSFVGNENDAIPGSGAAVVGDLQGKGQEWPSSSIHTRSYRCLLSSAEPNQWVTIMPGTGACLAA